MDKASPGTAAEGCFIFYIIIGQTEGGMYDLIIMWIIVLLFQCICYVTVYTVYGSSENLDLTFCG